MSNSLSEQEFLEMASITYKHTGIENIVLWVGPNPVSDYRRIKVSNTLNKFDGRDCFILTIPDYKIIGELNEYTIKPEVIEKIKVWCAKNMKVIVEYSDYEISTGELLESLQPL